MLENIIREAVGKAITNIEVIQELEDGSERRLIDEGELEEGMKFRISYGLNLEKKVSVTASYQVLEGRKIKLLTSVPVTGKVEPLEDIEPYREIATEKSRQIEKALTNALV